MLEVTLDPPKRILQGNTNAKRDPRFQTPVRFLQQVITNLVVIKAISITRGTHPRFHTQDLRSRKHFNLHSKRSATVLVAKNNPRRDALLRVASAQKAVSRANGKRNANRSFISPTFRTAFSHSRITPTMNVYTDYVMCSRER